MLEITAALLLIVWALGLFSGSALGAAAYILPMVALTAIVLRIHDGTRRKASATARPQIVHDAAPRGEQPAVASHARREQHARAA